MAVRQLTLVALLGSKPAAFARLVEDCQAELRRTAELGFAALPLEQVHATVVGLEALDDSPTTNRNLFRLRGIRRAMDLPGFVEVVARGAGLPFEVRFGGYGDRDADFTSRGLGPHERSFSLQDGLAVLVGWPALRAANGATTHVETLASLRLDALRFGILHAYHRAETDRDNDLYVRLGRFEARDVGRAAIDAAESRVRRLLATREPLFVRVSAAELALVEYDDPALPPATSRRIGLADATALARWAAERCRAAHR